MGNKNLNYMKKLNVLVMIIGKYYIVIGIKFKGLNFKIIILKKLSNILKYNNFK
jgi:hypothetical protein